MQLLSRYAVSAGGETLQSHNRLRGILLPTLEASSVQMAGQSAHLPPLPLLRLPGDAPLLGTAGLNTQQGPYIHQEQSLGDVAWVPLLLVKKLKPTSGIYSTAARVCQYGSQQVKIDPGSEQRTQNKTTTEFCRLILV